MSHYSRHKKPPNAAPSPFVVDTIQKLDLDSRLPILDLACGFGRHAKYFASLGYHVIAADFAQEVFRDGWYKASQCIYPVQLDATKPLPFTTLTFGAIFIVHFYHPNLFQSLHSYIASGGYLVYESINGHGDNWLELDFRGQIKECINKDFNLIYYKEKAVGPEKQYATVKMIAKSSH